MKERDDEYHEEMKAKMEKFLLEHAARVIQFAWREVLSNRAEKKKVRSNYPIYVNYFYTRQS